MDFYKDTWSVLNKYFESNYFLTKHHLDSYNDFVSNKLINTIKVLNPFIVVKNPDKTTHYEIKVYIGGKDASEIFIDKPVITENKEQSRLMYPNEARLKDMTYQSNIYANITIEYVMNNVIEVDSFKNVKIGSIPIMLHSRLCALNEQPKSVLQEMGECVYDQGGYFIIDGKEKVIVAQERIVTNKIFINESKDPKYSHEALIRCTSEENPLFPKTIHIYAHRYSVIPPAPKETQDDNKEVSQEEQEEIENAAKNPFSIVMNIPNVSLKKIPIFVLFRALGIESDKSIIEMIVPNENKTMMDYLRYSLLTSEFYSQEEAIQYLAKFVEYKNPDKVKHVLMYDLFPNMGIEFRHKALFLGVVINKFLRVILGMNKESDRDSYIYKRVDISGFLIANLFRDYYNQFRRTARSNIDREYEFGPWKNAGTIKNLVGKKNLAYIFQSQIIADGMKKSLKGSWGVNMVEEQQDADDIKQGLVQDLSRISYLGFISHLRRVNTPMDPTAKIIAPHRLHTSQWGIMCPCESPDGASIGLLKNMAIMCHITYDSSPAPIMNYLEELKLVKIHNVRNIDTPTKIFVNNNWVGVHQDTPTLFRALKLLKRNGLIDKYTSVSWNISEDEIHILTEAGRCTRPLYVYDNETLLIESYFKKKFEWQDLISSKNYEQHTPLATLFPGDKSIKSMIKSLEKTQSPIEFLDVEETNTSLIAMDNTKLSLQHSHCEIHPSTIFSVVTHNIPLANHNQAPRNIFSGAQGKQAIGCYATNFKDRIDTMSYVLHYPQKCLVNTRFCEYLNLNSLPNGENLIVAIATYSGYNMEDSVIMNKTSVERGMFNLTYFKNHVEKEESNAQENEALTFMNPMSLPMNEIKWANYTNLDANGLPKLNTYIEEGDAIIGKAKVKSEMIEDPTIENNLFGARIKKDVYSDRSVIADKTVSGIVDRVFIYIDDENLKTCKIRFRKTRTPELGDKCCSRMAQKGVVGMLIPQENMPFTKDGIVPDIIINPHAIPSRMTVGHLLETLLGKVGALQGTCIDGTPFNNNDYNSLYDTLQNKYNMQRHGNEIMYNGMYGTQMETEIFIGPIFYERLKHMVADKINYRQVNLRTIYNNKKETILKDAPVSAITRQPTKGRGNNGGLRIGEMEKDSILSHGMLGFLKESMMERSDKYEYILDNDECSILNKKHGDLNVSKVATPFAFKQLVHEMIGMSIKPMLYTSDSLAPVEEEEP